MSRVLLLSFLAALFVGAVGCNAPSDVSSSDVKAKEQQIDEATKKLNGGKLPQQGQGQDSQ